MDKFISFLLLLGVVWHILGPVIIIGFVVIVLINVFILKSFGQHGKK